MKKTVALVEINVYENMIPLVSGYLQAYATQLPLVREVFDFHKYTSNRNVPLAQLEQDLLSLNADVYAFSCYLWNIGLVKSATATLRKHFPNVEIMLGGPQVMHHAQDFIPSDSDRVVVCNGEGERTFAAYLQALATDRDFAGVPGLSYNRAGHIQTTAAADRIKNLDEIPSPYLNDLFEGQYDMGVIESNRGCPFHCGFCFWGAATNDTVHKFSEQRVRQDITWIASHGIPFLYLADANWGMMKRDVELSKHIVQTKQDTGLPVFVYFSAAKNSPDRVTQITETFTQADLLSAQPISMQSMSPETLEAVDRKNIKLTAYEALQANLNKQDMASFIEMIWPLPGETLASFKSGLQTLCANKAAHIVIYPHLLLHNTPLFNAREQYQFQVRPVQDGAAEAEIVVATKDVSPAEFKAGMWFIYCILALYNTRMLAKVAAYLHDQGIQSYSELFTAFATFCQARPDHPFTQFCERSIAQADYYDILNYPNVYHLACHAERVAFQKLLTTFAREQAWWANDQARFLFELDLLTQPFLYSNTPFEFPATETIMVGARDERNRCLDVTIAPQYASLIDWPAAQGDTPVEGNLDHRLGQRPHSDRQSREHNANYCNGMVMRIASIQPTLTPSVTTIDIK